MPIRDDSPVLLWHGHLLVDLIADDGLPPLDHGAGVDLVLQDPGHRSGRPEAFALFHLGTAKAQALAPFIGGGAQDPTLVQLSGDPALAHPLIDIPAVDIPHHLRRLLIDAQLIFISWKPLVAVGRERADELPFPPFCREGLPDIPGGLGRKAVVHQSVDRHLQPEQGLRVEIAVDLRLADRDEADSVLREDLLQEITLVRVIPEHAGKVLADDTVDPPRLHIPDHLSEGRAVVVGPCFSVVDIMSHKCERSLKTGLHIPGDDLLLVSDTQALIVPVLP